MIVVRVMRGAGAHLPARASEWALGAIMFNWGWILLLPRDQYAASGAFDLLERIMPEVMLGMLCLALGAARLFALTINGTFTNSTYSRYSPHVRASVALLSCAVWLQISLSFVTAPFGTGAAVYPVLLVLDLYSTFRAARDAKQADRQQADRVKDAGER